TEYRGAATDRRATKARPAGPRLAGHAAGRPRRGAARPETGG
ncbi:hypothetical protein FJSC11DRAFT_4627, partial [Fischerella thermalis JSC-11]